MVKDIKMDKIKCHSGTKKQELIDFVNSHLGKKINLHFECNIINSWGDDMDYTYDTANEKQLKELLETIDTHYIHGIKII